MMQHPDITQIEKYGFIKQDSVQISTFCKVCGCPCRNEMCTSCVEEAMQDDDIVLEYINSSADNLGDYVAYISTNYNGNETALTVEWIKEDLSDFREWLERRR